MSKTRIAVLGGGIGALSTVYEITSQPNWQQRFDITIYQQGWRLGGKAASSRNEKKRYRNEEHGFHILGGFYHNAFRLLRHCYAEWPQHSASALAFDAAFFKHSTFILKDLTDEGWQHIPIDFPENDEEPGIDPPPTIGIKTLLVRLLRWIKDQLKKMFFGDSKALNQVFLTRAQGADLVETDFSQALDRAIEIATMLEDDPELTDTDHRALAAEAVSASSWERNEKALGTYLSVLRDTVQDEGLQKSRATGKLDYVLMAELGLVILRGFIADRIYRRGYDWLNQFESMDWLRRHGASERVVNSTFVQSGYHYAFSYINGKMSGRSLATGAGLKGLIRLFLTYHGAVFYHMNGGMGEIVVTPIYQILKGRGVKFEFFHRIESLLLDDNGASLDRIEGKIQAHLLDPEKGYDPLIRWKDRDVWPAEPKYDQLKDGSQLESSGIDLEDWWADFSKCKAFSLRRGTDFDIAILGISAGALKHICTDLAAKNTAWSEMLNTLETVPTLGVQYWLTRDAQSLGWPDDNGLLTGFTLPLSTWADMSFLTQYEAPHQGSVPANLTYLTGPYSRANMVPDTPAAGFKAQELARATTVTEEWVDQYFQHILPGACDPATGHIDPSLVIEKYIRPNINPSDEYVLSVPGSVEKRLAPDESQITGLYLTGDWVRNGHDLGAVESAVVSGLMCSRALTGKPKVIWGEDHFQ